MIETIRGWLGNNEFLSGGMVLGLLGAAAMLLRQYGRMALRWGWAQWTVTLEVRNGDPCFQWIVVWLDQQPYARRARRLTVSLIGREPTAPRVLGAGQPEFRRPSMVFSPSVGSHLFLYDGRMLWLQRERKEPDQPMSAERESFTITLFGRSQALLRELLNTAFDTYDAMTREQSLIFASSWNGWRPQGHVRPRSMESVILPGDERETLMADVRRFLASEPWYHERGIPYRRGYLFAGVPGSGKSSLVTALSGEIGVHLYVVNLAGMSDGDLVDSLGNLSAPRAIVLFEDIDTAAAAKNREGQEESGDARRVTLAGLLNALDGVASRDGYITIMTTNCRQRLDPALTRPGRVDMELTFGFATHGQARALYARFYGDAAERMYGDQLLASLPTEVSMATLQEHFLRHRDDAAAGAAFHALHQPRRVHIVGAAAG